jgi:hypothetical protein
MVCVSTHGNQQVTLHLFINSKVLVTTVVIIHLYSLVKLQITLYKPINVSSQKKLQ